MSNPLLSLPDMAGAAVAPRARRRRALPAWKVALLALLPLAMAHAGHAQQGPLLNPAGGPILPGVTGGSANLRTSTPASTANPYSSAAITTRLIPGAGQTYGYEVLVNGHLLVTQPCVPGQPGNKGFRTQAEAQRVAQLVAAKVRANQMPPTVTEAELQRVHAAQ